MKKIKYILIGIIIGIIIVGSISVYAVEAVIESKEVSYDNKSSHGNYQDVQGSIDELYERSGIMKNKWVDPILNGADPVLGEGMIPVTIDDDGTVHYANLYTKWYEYETKKWANAVILVDSEKGKYKTGDKIPESAIESYFVWIPRYKYKIWNLGNYTSAYNFSDLENSEGAAATDFALRHITGKAQLIDIVFQKKEQKTANISGECAPDPTSGGGKSCQVGNYMTHPAFTLGEKELNGLWVGKFETGGTESNIVVKPNVVSWRNASVGVFWRRQYNYERNLDSHMMKNTEWGAVAYLSHSIYGTGTEVNINNNSDYKTGYSAAAGADQSSFHGIYGSDTNSTKAWNTSTGYLASTAGNITGVYDMSGGAWEYMAAYMDGYGVTSSGQVKSELSLNELSNNSKYFDKYSTSSNMTSYNLRILGDATGEMGPFYLYYDKDKIQQPHNAWYADYSYFVEPWIPWVMRGGHYADGVVAGQFFFSRHQGFMNDYLGSRLVLAI